MHTTTPPPSRTASCSCGQLQAQASGEPVRVSVCHCLACQRRTGSVFGAQARFPREAVSVVGTSAEYVRVGDEGTKATFRFCPKCGATVYYTLEGMVDAVAIPVGAFADPSFPTPSLSVYEERMHSWVSMPDGIERMA
jgi:hypothetical protein